MYYPHFDLYTKLYYTIRCVISIPDMKKNKSIEKNDFLIKVAKSVDELRKEVVDLKKDVQTQSVKQNTIQRIPELTVSAIWTQAPTQEQKQALHQHVSELMKLYGIMQANIRYVQTTNSIYTKSDVGIRP